MRGPGRGEGRGEVKRFGQLWSLLLLVGGVLFQPGIAKATITLCNSSAGEMGITVVLEDPNLLLFTRYPYTSRGLYTLRPAQCFDVSMGRSDGMRVHFQTYYQAEDGSWHPGQYDVRNAREVQRSGRRFCTHPDHGWDLSREDAVNCPPGYELSDFGYKLVVPSNAWDFRLSLTADRPPPASSETSTVIRERLEDADRLDRLLKDGLSGKDCNRAEDVWMRYLKNDVSVSPQGVLRARVENWYDGKLTSSSAAEVRIQDIAHVEQKRIEGCYVLDLTCDSATSEKGRLGHCVKSTSLGTSDSLRLYFPSEFSATSFRELASRHFSEETHSDSGEQ